MFSRAKRQSKVPQTRPTVTHDSVPTRLPSSPSLQSASFSTRSESPALPSPAFSTFDAVRPSSSDSAHLGQRKSRTAFGPPFLPPIPRVASSVDSTGVRRVTGSSSSGAPVLPVLSLLDDADNLSLASSSTTTTTRRTSALRSQRSFDHFSRPRSVASTAHHAASQSGSPKITQSGFEQAAPTTPPTPVRHAKAAAGRHNVQSVSDEKEASDITDFAFPPPSSNILDIDFDSPVMEASMFPSYTPKQPLPVLPAPPLMNRSFIDSRDRPYSQPATRSPPISPPISQYEPLSQSPFAQHYVLPSSRASSIQQPNPRTPTSIRKPSSVGMVSIKPSEPTIGLPFESTSIKHPPPKFVQTRPTTEGLVSKVAGVDVPTFHSSSVKAKRQTQQKRKSLNPASLFGRRKSVVSVVASGENEKKAQALATEVQKTVASVGVPKIPADYDPRIKGKIVHDFSAPRRSTMSPVDANFPNGISGDSSPSQARQPRNLSAQHARPISRSPVFVENFGAEDRPSPIDRASGGIGAEHRENKGFLARFSQQSSTSTFSQESAILPPFARKSQIIDAGNPSFWREDEGSWSSGRDSGGHSSAVPGDRESGLSSFSLQSPMTRGSSGSNQSHANGLGFTFDSSIFANMSPTSPHFEHKTDSLERPISIASDNLRPRSHSESTARLVPKPGDESQQSIHGEPLDHRSILPSQTQAGAELETADQKQRMSARRFSFQSTVNGDAEESELERKADELAPPVPTTQGLDMDEDEDDFEYFDENAIDDLDEFEMQNQDAMPSISSLTTHPVLEDSQQQEAARHQTEPGPYTEVSKHSNIVHNTEPAAAPNPTYQPQPNLQPSPDLLPASDEDAAAAKSISRVRRANSDDFFYEGHIPYQPNEREVTYAEHPVFQTHSALVDSRRTSFQSTFLDSYLASSPTASSPRRNDDSSGSERRGSTPSVFSSRGRDRSASGSSVVASTRGGSTQVTSASIMSPLQEGDESGMNTEKDPSTPVNNNALQEFRFSESPATPESPQTRTESDTEPPRWGRTANLWKQFSIETPSRSSTPGLNPDSANRGGSNRYSTSESVRVRQPTGGLRQSRNSVISSQRASAIPITERLTPRTVRGVRGDRLSTRSPLLGVPRGSSALGGESRPLSKLSMTSMVQGPPLVPHNTVDSARIGVASSETEQRSGAPRVHLQAYHQALADAANQAAAAGRFTRQHSTATVDTAVLDPVPLEQLNITNNRRMQTTSEQPEKIRSADTADTIRDPSSQIPTVADASNSPNKMAFDFGFGDGGISDSTWDENNEDDDMVAAANADVLANDADGFYGTEFSFYAKAKPGMDQSIEATDGGYFGEDGDDGLARRRSVKEPNLTPITERSEFSTRNSFVGLGGFATPTITTPSLARMPMNVLSEGDIVSFEQLKRLRQNTFGGSSISLSSKGSPTSPHFASSVAASDSTGSVDSRHQSAILDDLNHNAAIVQQTLSSHKSSPLISH